MIVLTFLVPTNACPVKNPPRNLDTLVVQTFRTSSFMKVTWKKSIICSVTIDYVFIFQIVEEDGSLLEIGKLISLHLWNNNNNNNL